MPPRDPNLPEGTDSIIDDDGNMSDAEFAAGGLDAGVTGGESYGSSSSDAGSFGAASSDADVAAGGLSSAGSMSGSTYGSGLGGSAAGGMGSSGSGYDDGGLGGSSSASGGAMSSGGRSMDVQSLKAQATDKVRGAASQGKDRATEALSSVSQLVTETADTVDERLGPQYGNYVRQAAGAIDNLTASIRGKEVDELFDDARDLVRKSPAVAIGAAAAVGFLLVRLVKSGMPDAGSSKGDYSSDYSGSSTQRLGSPPRVDNSYDPVA